MATYSLVHGAWHGGWAWDLVRADLESRGHVVHTPDLPCDEVGLTPEDYAAAPLRQVEVDAGHSPMLECPSVLAELFDRLAV